MTIRFPVSPHYIDHDERQTNIYFDHSEVPGDVQYNFAHLIDVSKRVKSLGRLCQPRGVAIDYTNNNICTVGGVYGDSCVTIFSNTGKFINLFSLERVREPFSIALHKDSAFVTDVKGHSISHFKTTEDFRLVGKIGRKGPRLGHFNEPRQLSVSPNEEIFVTDQNNDRIQILDINLRSRRSISHDIMTEPRDINITLNEVYVLCPRDDPFILVFSHAGDLTRSVDIDEQVCCPTTFCVDAFKNIIISYWGDDQVKIFSKDGTLLHTLGWLRRPHRIAIADNFSLIVLSESDQSALKILYS